MQLKTSLMRGAALGAGLALAAGMSAQAAVHTHKKIVRHHVEAESGELSALRDEVRALKAQLDAQGAQQAQTQAQAAQAAQTAAAAQDQIETAQAADADATAAIIQSIPTAVAAEADKLKPKTDGIYFKGVKITPGGFVEAAGIYREHNLASDVASPFNSIPYPVTRTGHAEELRATARQSRISGLVEGNVNPDLKLSAYAEFDFLGAAQTANSNESNSFNLRTRVVYATADWAPYGLHFLAGDSWSLVTMNSKGITPRNEVLPPNIDAQYNVGYVWARQPQFRITKDMFNKNLWAAVSIENPQTTFGGSPATANGIVYNINNGANFYGGTTSSGAAATQSLNHVPDIVGKLATEQDFMGRHLHAEVFGLYRSFYEQLGNLKTNNVDAGSVGGGLAVQVIPGLLDAQVTGITGNGVGRYGTSGLPDVAFTPSGKISAIQETAGLFTVTAHATKNLDLYIVGGQEQDVRPDAGKASYGSFTAVNTGCNIEASALTCTGNTRELSELTFQAWDKAFTGPFGQIRLGLEYSYVARKAFAGIGGAPDAHDNMIFTSIRYYPF